jgi:hypothetical protein
MKYKLFVDSIILKIKYQSFNHEYDFNKLLSYLHNCGYKRTQSTKDNSLNKFKGMYLHRDAFGKALLEVLTLDTLVNKKSIFFVYALKHGLYIEINGLMQYGQDYRKEKLSLLHKVWNKYENCSISKLDIAMDMECNLQDIKVYDKRFNSLNKSEKSNKGISYFLEGVYSKYNNKQRKLKAYSKANQRFREFPLAMELSRIEMTLKSQKLKGLTDAEGFSARIIKEYAHYVFTHQEEEIYISEDSVKDMCQNLFLMFTKGRNSKKYSNFYKNIDVKVKSMKLAWDSIIKNISLQEFVKNNPIAMTALKKYRTYYKNR